MTVAWLNAKIIKAIHFQLLGEHGGVHGVNDDNLEASLARPRHLQVYAAQSPSIPTLAASYAYGFARNHCFADGNKRIALAATDVFLRLNGYELTASETEAVYVFRELAAGNLTLEEIDLWVAANTQPLSRPESTTGDM